MMKDITSKSENIQAGMKILEKQNRRREIKRRKLQNSGKDFEEIQHEKAMNSVIKVVNRVNFKLKFESFAELLKNQIKCEKVVFYLKLKQSRREKDIFRAWKHIKDCSKLKNKILFMLCRQLMKRTIKESLVNLTSNFHGNLLRINCSKLIFKSFCIKRLTNYFSIFKNQHKEHISARSLLGIEKLAKLARNKGFCMLNAMITHTIYMKALSERSIITTNKQEHLMNLKQSENNNKFLGICFASEKLSKLLNISKFHAFSSMKALIIHLPLKLSASLLLLACSKFFKNHKKFAFSHLKSHRILSLYSSSLTLLTNIFTKKQKAFKLFSLSIIKKHTNIKKSRYPIWKQKFYQLEGFIKYRTHQRSLIIKKQKFLRWKVLVERLSQQNKKHIEKVCKKMIEKLQPIFDKYQHKVIY